MGKSGQKIRRFYYTRYRNSEQQIFASQYENIQLKFIRQQGFPFTFSQPLLTKTGPEIYPLFGQISGPVLPVPGGAYLSCGSRMDRYCMDRWGIQRGRSSTWHTILLAKYSVLYLLRPLTLEGGCHRTGQTFSCGSRRTNICKHGRLADIRSSGVGDAAKCRSLTETMLYHRGSKRYIKPAAATHPQKSSLIHPSFRRLFSKLHSMLQ